MRKRLQASGLVGMLFWAGCGGELIPADEARLSAPLLHAEGAVEQPLLDHSLWAPLPAPQDPLVDHRPWEDDCPEASWREELGALEVETGHCRYFSAAQPLPTALEAGDRLRLVLWHSALSSATEGDGHVALLLDDHVLWEQRVPIPSKGQIYDVEVVLADSWPADAALTFHLHNHGFNAWKLLSFSRVTKPQDAPRADSES